MIPRLVELWQSCSPRPATTWFSARTWGPDPGDEALLATANAQQRAVITVDQNFGRAVVAGLVGDVGIIFLPDVPVPLRLALVGAAISAHENDLVLGCWVVARPGRMRVRMPPHDPSKRR